MYLLLILANLLATAPVSAQTYPTHPGDLTITEFMAEPTAVADFNGEWFEIHNTTTARLRLEGLVISGADDVGFTIEPGVFIEPGDYLVLGVNADTNANGGIPVDYVYDFYDFDLSRTGDTITLTFNGQVIDTVTWNSTDWGVARYYSHEVNRNAENLEWANDLAHNWCVSDTYIPGVGLKGTPGAQSEWCDESNRDNDGDGYTPTSGDCDDHDAYVNPDAIDGSDGVTYGNPNDDADCDGIRDDGDTDDDLDGYAEVDGDCNDSDSSMKPNGFEGYATAQADGKDNDCDCYIDDLDLDQDGYADYLKATRSPAPGCDDSDALLNDCNDEEETIHPNAVEKPYDAIDQDCDGFDACDMDHDGHDAIPEDVCPGESCCSGGDDCDDANSAVHPDATEGEEPDGIDNDCSGIADDPFLDQDGDAYSILDGDCLDDPDDSRSAQVHPGAQELCTDFLDNDCDGLYNEGCSNLTRFAGLQGGGCGAVPRSAAGAMLLSLIATLGLAFRQRRA